MELYEKTCNWFREGTDFMELTKEKALELHRQLWNYIADESERQGRIVSKKEAFNHFGWPGIAQYCWCCEFSIQKLRNFDKEHGYVDIRWKCDFCPIIWKDEYFICVSLFSPFHSWDYLYNKGDKADWYDVQDAIKYAREIANLPERKD